MLFGIHTSFREPCIFVGGDLCGRIDNIECLGEAAPCDYKQLIINGVMYKYECIIKNSGAKICRMRDMQGRWILRFVQKINPQSAPKLKGGLNSAKREE